jgi:translation initiation factor 5B
LAGKILPRISLLRAEDGEELGEIQQIQDKGKALPQASKGMEVAVSMDKPVVGRHVFEKDILYAKIPEQHAKLLLLTFLDRLTEDERESLNEYVEMMRKEMPFWAA